MRQGRWKLVLLFSLIAAVLYGLYAIPGAGPGARRMPQGSSGPSASAHDEHDHEHEHPAAMPIDVAAMEAALSDPAALAAGHSTYERTCAPCHEEHGGGSIGPNLTDDYWMHGNTHDRMLAIVAYGVPEKGMPGWSTVLTPEQVAQVTAYTATLHGTKAGSGKAPQGEKLGAPVAGGGPAAESAK